MLHLQNRRINNRSFFFSLLLYFYIFKYNIYIFYQINILKNKVFLYFILNLRKVYPLAYMKINILNILNIFNYHNEFFFNLFKRDLFFVSINNLFILNKLLILPFLILFCIDNYFINIKYLGNINNLFNILQNNYNIYKIFFFKIFYIYYNYFYFFIYNKFYILN